MPEGWVWATAEQICTFITKGSTPDKNELFADQGEVPFIKVYNLTKTGKLDFTINPTYVRFKTHNSLLNRSKAYPGDVLINIVGPPLGKVAIVPDDHPEWNINQAIAAFNPLPSYSNRFLLTSLLTETIMKWLLKQANTTTSQVNLTLAMCRQLPLPVPPLAEQAEIVAEAERRLSTIDALEHTLADELKRAERLRQSLLHRAFTGRLVPQDATDEPASALLARLTAQVTSPKKGEGPASGGGKRGRKPKAAGTQIGLSF
ncbi:restriction endonuclease subunit S [Hymenobacter sp. DG25B]|uniref:restriction endonuclease subunit S n=1 Tax=Hymenobacter sp. DG25B TaxID=1385664 RepID=UPI0009006FEA|nr:restriction endonuclease subunit S [Hymenobacter sp. DG25B]